LNIRLIRLSITLGTLFFAISSPLIAQQQRDAVPLRPWPAPLYWQPTDAENQAAATTLNIFANTGVADTRPANSLVFVGMTPCRVVDTRTGSGFTGAFGTPNLVGGASRTFPIRSSTTCSIPSIAQAYSFNITIVPPGFLDFITVWPTGQARPNASTLNGYVNTVIANAAIVPAGTSGSVDVYASQNTDLIIDINGYYAPQTGITLAQGTAGAPSLSFTNDPGTGIFSSGASTLNIATGGTSRLSIASNGDANLTGNLDIGGSVGIGTTTTTGRLHVQGQAGFVGVYGNSSSVDGIGTGVWGNVTGDGGEGVRGFATTGTGVFGNSGAGYGMVGIGGSTGVYGLSVDGYGVYGSSSTSYAGYFDGNVNVTGTITQNSDARLKQGVANLGYGLREVRQLRPVSWNWKAKPDGSRQLGLIAQEVETLLPELVTADKDAEQTKGLNYIGLVPVTIKAIQEQQTQIEQQQAQIEDQQKRISEQQEKLLQQQEQNLKLEERLAALEALLSGKVQSSAGNQ
jgi:endosialidase-like protein